MNNLKQISNGVNYFNPILSPAMFRITKAFILKVTKVYAIIKTRIYANKG